MSPDVLVSHVAAYGFDHLIGSRFPALPFREALDHDGVLTPEDEPRLVGELCERRQIDGDRVVAYGDPQSDVPLFRRVAGPVAINADEHVSHLARVRCAGDDLYDAYLLGQAALREG